MKKRAFSLPEFNAAVFYDAQGKVINFSEAYAADPGWIVADEIYDFVICVDPPGQDVPHKLQAWSL